jgi:hypothetical protein
VRAVTIHTLSPGKRFMRGDFCGDSGESLVTSEAQSAAGRSFLEQRPLSGPMGLVALAAVACGERAVEAVLSHFVLGLLVAREAEFALLVGKQCLLVGLMGLMALQTSTLSSGPMHKDPRGEIGPLVALVAEGLRGFLEEMWD